MPASVALVQCYVENAGESNICESANAGVSVLRMFRLARLVRLVRAFPQVQRQVCECWEERRMSCLSVSRA